MERTQAIGEVLLAIQKIQRNWMMCYGLKINWARFYFFYKTVTNDNNLTYMPIIFKKK